MDCSAQQERERERLLAAAVMQSGATSPLPSIVERDEIRSVCDSNPNFSSICLDILSRSIRSSMRRENTLKQEGNGPIDERATRAMNYDPLTSITYMFHY